MKTRLTLAIGVLVIISYAVTPTLAQSAPDWGPINVHITSILNVQAAPLSFDFGTDNTPSTCNGAIFYFATGTDVPTQLANGNAVLATLLAAQLSGHSVSIWGNNPSGGFSYCKVVTLHINNQ